MELPPPFRHATPADAPVLAKLVNMAGEGLPLHLWTQMAEAGEDPWEVGRKRAQRDSGSFSYRHAIVLEHQRQVVACLIGYPLPDQPQPIGDDMPPMFVPLQELENLAPDTWYVNVLATMPEYRGQGYGSALLELAEGVAAEHGKWGLSIIVSDGNRAARRLYERHGCRQIATRPIVKDGWENPGREWVLLLKERSAISPS